MTTEEQIAFQNGFATGYKIAKGMVFKISSDVFSDVWDTVTYESIPYNTYNHTAVAIGTDIYVMGGGSSLRQNYNYDTLTNSWTQMTDLPYNTYDHTAVAIGTDIYVMGGYYSNDNYKYNTLTNSWVKMTDVPYGNYVARQHTAVAVGTDVYVMGGFYYSKHNYKYSSLTNSWTQMTDVPYNAYDHTAVYCNNAIHVMGGSIRPYMNIRYK